MTYCLSMLCREGAIFLADSRTSAGMDNITIHPKMRIFAREGERVLCLMTSGNLSLTQTVLSLIDEDEMRAEKDGEAASHLMNQPTLFETARYLGAKIRQLDRLDRDALKRDGFSFNINILMGGQIAGQPHEIYQVYPQGNCIHADQEAPFLQIGEFKYGKPILDRGFTYETKLREALKFGVLSLESTMKSNVSVGTPFDIFCYEKDSLRVEFRERLEDGDPYLLEVRQKWQNGLIELVRQIPVPQFKGHERQPGEERK